VLRHLTERSLPMLNVLAYNEVMAQDAQIQIISSLPCVAFMGVLAHELLHVWIHEQGLQRMNEDLDPAYGAGYCALAWQLQNQGWPALLAAMQDPTYAWPAAPTKITQAHEQILQAPANSLALATTSPMRLVASSRENWVCRLQCTNWGVDISGPRVKQRCFHCTDPAHCRTS